jgi:SAM-dependent methyltransferase
MSSADFPRYFEAQYAAYVEDIPFWLELAQACGGPVLELGCGYGRVLGALARAGIPAFGIDHDPGMLVRAAAYLSEEVSRRISLHQADIRDFTLGRSFPLVISPCNTFALFPDQDFLRAAVCASHHLRREAHLVLDLPPERQMEPQLTDVAEVGSAFDDLETGNPVQVSSTETVDGSVVHVTWLYDELLPNGKVERTEIPMTYYLRDPDELFDLLSTAGYHSVEFFGDFQHGAYQRHSDRIVVSASV